MLIYEAIQIGTVAFVYAVLLVEPGHILFRFKSFMKNLLVKEKQVPLKTDVPEVLLNDPDFMKTYIPPTTTVEIESWFWKPLIGCERCVSGQAALWFYLIVHGWSLEILFFISVSIITTLTLSKIYARFNN